jgi:hypothetical protein
MLRRYSGRSYSKARSRDASARWRSRAASEDRLQSVAGGYTSDAACGFWVVNRRLKSRRSQFLPPTGRVRPTRLRSRHVLLRPVGLLVGCAAYVDHAVRLHSTVGCDGVEDRATMTRTTAITPNESFVCECAHDFIQPGPSRRAYSRFCHCILSGVSEPPRLRATM